MDKKARINQIRSNFPPDLLQLAQWVCWRIEVRDDKPTKVPYSITGSKAASDKPSTWTAFELAAKAFIGGNYSGVGFMFSEHDPYIGIDFDKCAGTDGEVKPKILHMVDLLDSYTEWSQSSAGLHVIARGTLPPGGRKSNQHQIEMYDRLRFFVVTGDRLGGFPATVNERQSQIEQFHADIFPAKTPEPSPMPGHRISASIPDDDQELLERMFASRNGADIQALWRGDRSKYNGDESSADLALCNHLAFWTGNDAGRIDRMFRQSRLYRDKWDRNARTGETYGAGTISRAIAATLETYTPRVYTNGHKPMPEDEPARQDIDNILIREGAHDEGNAQCVHARYKGKFLHSTALGWLSHTGTHWTMDEAEAMVERAITETLIARAETALRSGKPDAELIKRCVPTSGHVQGTKSQLRSLVSTVPEKFDTDPDYLNCRNGVVDLRTGNLLSHSPGQRFMHCTAVDYVPSANQAPWMNWLTDAVGPQMADWLQIAVGYSITGQTREEILFYLYGPSRSGKGTFTETLLSLLGAPLAKEVSFSMFLAQRTGDSQNFDLAPLKPCRFVAASESNTYERFNEAKIKALTGGNEIYCAFKHHTHFNYRPQFKIWLSSNQPINADPDDEAVWGRIRIVEFLHSHLGNEDKSLKHDMRSPEILTGVLAWAIQGAIRWYKLGKTGLPETETSVQAKTVQRAELDNVQAWLDETCALSDVFCAYSALYNSYESWCKDRGVEPKKQKGFSQSLIHKGFINKSARLDTKAVRGFMGLRLL